MLRNCFAAVLFSVLLACGGAFAGTEAEAQEQAIAAAMEAMANEPPLSQADIDAFLNMAPKVEEVMNDQEAVLKLYRDNNVTPQRFGLVSTRISVGLLMSAQGLTREQLAASGQFLDFMLPNDEEVALIAKNMDAIMKALD